MDLDVDHFYTVGGEFLKCSQVDECLDFCLLVKFILNTKIRDQNLSPSKVDTLLFGKYLS